MTLVNERIDMIPSSRLHEEQQHGRRCRNLVARGSPPSQSESGALACCSCKTVSDRLYRALHVLRAGAPYTPRTECLMSHVSCLMSHVSCLMSHVSCLTSHVSPHVSCLISHVSYLISHVAYLMSSCLMCHISCVMCHVSCLTSQSQ